MQTQRELFDEPSPKQAGDFAEFRAGSKIIPVQFSVWADGRIRADLSKHGARKLVSRRWENLSRKIIEELQPIFGQVIEAAIHQEEFTRPPNRTPRQSNKRPLTQEKSSSPVRYVNPFSEKWSFAKCPDWLLARREVTAIEKHVYGKLLHPLRPICQRWDQDNGIILGLNQRELANALGIPRQSVNQALMALRRRALIECTGPAGAVQCIRFLWHKWMDETCQLTGQVKSSKPASESDKSCHNLGQAPATKTDSTCPPCGQLSVSIKKRELLETREPALSTSDWIERIASEPHPNWKHNNWTSKDLKQQWSKHSEKGKTRGRWLPGDRGHFLKAWMPIAEPPNMGLKTQTVEPDWWLDFIDECYPNAPERRFEIVAQRHPEIVAEGKAWAKSVRADSNPPPR